jgi:hypothetical protein
MLPLQPLEVAHHPHELRIGSAHDSPFFQPAAPQEGD